MRRFVLIMLLMLALLPATISSAAAPPRIVIDGQELPLPPGREPVLEDGRTLVPLRAIFEALGAEVSWDGETGTVTAVKGTTTVTIQIGSYVGWVGDTKVGLEVPPRILEGSTYVPLRFVSESFGAAVAWDGATRTISITPAPLADTVPVVRVENGPLKHVTYGPGATVQMAEEGIYWMKVQTGEIEGWQIPNEDKLASGFTPSPDNLYARVRTEERSYLVVRSSGEVFTWDRAKVELVGAQGDRLLWLKGRDEFIITDANFRHISAFKVRGAGEAQQVQAFFEPSGRKVAVLTSADLLLVDVATGKAERLSDGSGNLRYFGTGDGFVHQSVSNGATYQYDWSGKLVGKYHRAVGFLSPDGSTYAYSDLVAGFLPVIHLTRAGEVQPFARVLDASACYGFGSSNHWVSAGAGLLVNTKQGIRILENGKLSPVPGLRNEAYVNPLPSPAGDGLIFNNAWDGNSDTQLLEVLDASGRQLSQVKIQRAHNAINLYRSLDPWGLSTGQAPTEVRFAAARIGGTGGPCGDFGPLVAPKFQGVPFGDVLVLEVQGTGDCLNMRSAPGLKGEVVACLKDGARLTVKVPTGGPSSSHWWEDGHFWVPVVTGDGVAGWVAITSGYLEWAD